MPLPNIVSFSSPYTHTQSYTHVQTHTHTQLQSPLRWLKDRKCDVHTYTCTHISQLISYSADDNKSILNRQMIEVVQKNSEIHPTVNNTYICNSVLSYLSWLARCNSCCHWETHPLLHNYTLKMPFILAILHMYLMPFGDPSHIHTHILSKPKHVKSELGSYQM